MLIGSTPPRCFLGAPVIKLSACDQIACISGTLDPPQSILHPRRCKLTHTVFAVFVLVYYLEVFEVLGARQSRMCPTVLGLGALGVIIFLCQWSRRRNQSVMSQSKHPAGSRLQDISHVHCPAEVCVCINVFWPLTSSRVRKRPQALRWWHQPILSSVLLLCCPTVPLETLIHSGCQWKPHPLQTCLSWQRYCIVLY